MKKTFSIANLIILILSISALVGSVFGYFVFSSNGVSDDFTTSVNASGNTNITSENDLRIVARDGYFENLQDVSNMSARKTLALTKNIVLTSNLTIESDININFSGFYIDVNGFQLMIRHNYFGNLLLFSKPNGAIANGGIKDGAANGKFVMQTPNCTIKEDTTFECTATKQIVDFDFNASCAEIFNYLDSVIATDYIGDIPFVFSYKGLPISFEYTPDATLATAVNSVGNVTRQTADVVGSFTVKLLSKGSTMVAPQTKVFNNIKVLATGNTLLDVGKSIVDRYFSNYFVNNAYVISNDVALLTRDNYYGLEFVYSDKNGVLSALKVNSCPADVTATIKKDGVVLGITNQYSFTSTAFSNNAISVDFFNAFGIVRIENKLSDIDLTTKKNDIVAKLPNISQVTFKLTAAAQKFYKIEEINGVSHLKVKGDLLPSVLDEIYMDVTLQFAKGAPQTYTKQVRIYYVYAEEGGGEVGPDAYPAIYNYLFAEMQNIVGSGTFTTFTMPNAYKGHIIRYQINPNTARTDLTLNSDSLMTTFNINTANLKCLNEIITIDLYFDRETTPYSLKLSFNLLGLIQNNAIGVKNLALYNAIKSQFNLNGDNFLTYDEVTLNARADFSFSGNVGVDGYKGIEFLKNVTNYNFSNGTLSDLFTYLIIDNVKTLKLTTFGLTADSLAAFPMFNWLTDLDLSGNTIANLDKLAIYPQLTTLNMSAQTFNNYDAIYKYAALVNVTIDDNGVSIRPFSALEKLRKIVLIGGDGQIDLYNKTAYTILYSLGVEFYHSNVLVTAPTATEIIISNVLESIFYFKQGSTIKVPTLMKTYAIVWTGATGSDANNIKTITIPAGTASITLTASCTVNGITMYRQFVIKRV